MPQSKYRYRNVERADNTAQIGIRNNRRAIETVENRYTLARRRKAQGKNTFKDDRLLDYRNQGSLYNQMRRGTGAVQSVYPEFDIINLASAGKILANLYKSSNYYKARQISKELNKMVREGPKPIIDKHNARYITNKEWDEAYFTALNNNDIKEAERLRALHFGAKANNSITVNKGRPKKLYRGGSGKYNSFNVDKIGTSAGKRGATYGWGIYGTPYKDYAEVFGSNVRPIYMKLNSPRLLLNDLNVHPNGSITEMLRRKGQKYFVTNNSDGAIGLIKHEENVGAPEYISYNPRNIKSAEVITRDNNGNIIPLSKRDNFSVNDIRYGIIPTILSTGAATLYSNNKSKSRKRRYN